MRCCGSSSSITLLVEKTHVDVHCWVRVHVQLPPFRGKTVELARRDFLVAPDAFGGGGLTLGTFRLGRGLLQGFALIFGSGGPKFGRGDFHNMLLTLAR